MHFFLNLFILLFKAEFACLVATSVDYFFLFSSGIQLCIIIRVRDEVLSHVDFNYSVDYSTNGIYENISLLIASMGFIM